jgi:hypothetical protein
MEVDNERFKEVVKANCEVEVNLDELVNNIKINFDGNFESSGKGIEIIMTPDYQVVMLAGGVTLEASRVIMESDYECDNDE